MFKNNIEIIKKINQNTPSNKTQEKNATTNPSDQHVIPHENGWAVKSANKEKADYIFPLKQFALTQARLIAQKFQTKLVIFKKDGTLQHTISYQLR